MNLKNILFGVVGLVLFVFLSGCKNESNHSGNPPSNENPVAISWFSASSDLVSSGDNVTLNWVTREATSCNIDPGAIQAVPTNNGGAVVTVSATTTFILTCQGRDGPVSSNPVTVHVTDSDWSQVSASDHSCALKNDGRLFCWGFNYAGQLGNNSTSNSPVPVQESTAATDWAQISAGNDYTCALKKDGRLFCWGHNVTGQLGNNSTSNSLVPVQESTAATDWAQVSAGNDHTCAVKKDGRLFCWGYNDEGQLGNNSTLTSPVPVQENTASTDWAQVSAGGDNTCAVKKDGRLFCWGDNFYGELGNNSTEQRSLVPVQENTAATDWAQVSTITFCTCATKNDGRLFCWGSGTLANNLIAQSSVPVQEGTTAIDWTQVSVGAGHACALKDDGRLFCWGGNLDGRLGNNLASQSLVPVQESTTATDWAQVSAGNNHTCAVKKDGRLFCWGNNSNYQLGNNLTSESLVPVQECTTATDWLQVSGGEFFTCAVKRDGRLFCWGDNSYGQFGNDSPRTFVPVQESSAATDWTQVSTGAFHTCAVKNDGRLFCSGGSTLEPLKQESTAATDWAQVSVSVAAILSKNEHTCAVKKDGRLFCWGYGENGELGNNSFANSSVPVQESTTATDWAQVSAGNDHTCAVKKDGRLFCWGAGRYGQLGNNSTSNSPVPIRESTAATNWAQVSASNGNTCAVKKDGGLFCWGADHYGQLGNNSTSQSLVPVQESTTATDWAQVSGGGLYFTCAVKTDGRLFCWGYGESGELGNNSTSDSSKPMQENAVATDWIQVSNGETHVCAVKKDGRLFCWGEDYYDQLGRIDFTPVWPTN